VRVGLCLGVPTSVPFDALLSKLQSADADPVSILIMLSCILGGDSSLLARAVDARIAVGDDAAWLKLLSAVRWPNLSTISKESLKSIRDCVTPLILDETTNPAVLLDALKVFYCLVERDENDAIKAKQRFMIDIPDIHVHLIRLLHHPASDRVQVAALKMLSRSFELRPRLMRKCLRRQLINLDNFGHFCHESMMGESQEPLSMIVQYMDEPTLRPFYMDCLPLLVRILCSIDVDADRRLTSYDCLYIIDQSVMEFGRPAVLLLMQVDIITPLIELIECAPFCGGFTNNLHVCDILAALLQNDIREHGDDGRTLHPWMLQLVESVEGLEGLEGTHEYTRHRRSMRTMVNVTCCSPAPWLNSSR
jgi:hypothetical protein